MEDDKHTVSNKWEIGFKIENTQKNSLFVLVPQAKH